jgi:hypothetical protein
MHQSQRHIYKQLYTCAPRWFTCLFMDFKSQFTNRKQQILFPFHVIHNNKTIPALIQNLLLHPKLKFYNTTDFKARDGENWIILLVNLWMAYWTCYWCWLQFVFSSVERRAIFWVLAPMRRAWPTRYHDIHK